MKTTLTLLLLTILIAEATAQNCTPDFNYTIGSNNVVTFNDGTSFNCSPNSTVYYTFDFDDASSGNLNFGNIFGGLTHFFKSPGVYDVCYWANSGNGEQNCICHDSICHQVTITNTGSNCEANYCYTATDLGGYMEVAFSNLSVADDSIVDVYWDYGDGIQSIEYERIHTYFTVPSNADFLCNLYIQTANGCQSVALDTIKLGTHCTSISTEAIETELSSAEIEIFPTLISSTATISINQVEENMSFQLIDLLGRSVAQIPLTSTKTQFERNEAMIAGTYVYRVLMGYNTIKTGKLILE